MLEGILYKKAIEEANLKISISGYKEILVKIVENQFDFSIDLTEDKNSIHEYLEEKYTLIQFHLAGKLSFNKNYNWGLSKIILEV